MEDNSNLLAVVSNSYIRLSNTQQSGLDESGSNTQQSGLDEPESNTQQSLRSVHRRTLTVAWAPGRSDTEMQLNSQANWWLWRKGNQNVKNICYIEETSSVCVWVSVHAGCCVCCVGYPSPRVAFIFLPHPPPPSLQLEVIAHPDTHWLLYILPVLFTHSARLTLIYFTRLTRWWIFTRARTVTPDVRPQSPGNAPPLHHCSPKALSPAFASLRGSLASASGPAVEHTKALGFSYQNSECHPGPQSTKTAAVVPFYNVFNGCIYLPLSHIPE